jgi:hypothetical protein
LPTVRPGFLVTGFARLLRGSGSRAVVATLVATVHAIRLRGRRRDASERYDGSQDTNDSPKLHLSSHTVLLWYSDRSLKPKGRTILQLPVPPSPQQGSGREARASKDARILRVLQTYGKGYQQERICIFLPDLYRNKLAFF